MLKILMNNELVNEVAVVVGTRPGIIKFSPVIRALQEKSVPHFLIHTGQHYSFNMDKQFFEDLELPSPRYTNDKVREQTQHGAQTAEMIKGIELALLDSRPKFVIVGGDANTNFAAAVAARKLGLNLLHMEAGLRSNDWRMPEEHNRVMIDHISDILLAPTKNAKQNLIEDNVKGEIHLVGNTIVDAVYQNIKLSEKKSSIIERLSLTRGDYFLLTIHREETVDNKTTLIKLIDNFEVINNKFNKTIVFPIHPRTRKRIKQFGIVDKLDRIENIKQIEAVGYFEFLSLLKSSMVVLTDSGGIQEESCILKVPCITLRENTERPETLEVGANHIVGTNQELTIEAIRSIVEDNKADWNNPFGDGKAAMRIAEIIESHLKKNKA